jgi:hypothetical protein
MPVITMADNKSLKRTHKLRPEPLTKATDLSHLPKPLIFKP